MKIIDPVLSHINSYIEIIKHDIDFVKTLEKNFLPFSGASDMMATTARRTVGLYLSF